jgi:hypothetical protein
MNTIQIDKLLKACKLPLYRGVYASDQIPSRTGCYVINLDPHDQAGSHWVSMYISADRSYGEYFDSFGRPPDGRLKAYMDKHCKRWIFNRQQLQSVVSVYCGFYCIAYIVFRSRKNASMPKFLALFSRDTGYNDALVRRVVRRMCGVNKRV